mmetsp:Transcript_100678/g.323260  ORF Transcript_100678/g.323260 Transcript_100678/m.323260 type:complete len:305 (-) Transcript_100678:424-1338(-)
MPRQALETRPFRTPASPASPVGLALLRLPPPPPRPPLSTGRRLRVLALPGPAALRPQGCRRDGVGAGRLAGIGDEELVEGRGAIARAGGRMGAAQEDGLQHSQGQVVLDDNDAASLLVEDHMLLGQALGGPIDEDARQGVLRRRLPEGTGLCGKGFEQRLRVEELVQPPFRRLPPCAHGEPFEALLCMTVELGLLHKCLVEAKLISEVCQQAAFEVSRIIKFIRAAQLRAFLKCQHLHGHGLVLVSQSQQMASEIQRDAPNLQRNPLHGAGLHGLAVGEGLGHLAQVLSDARCPSVPLVHDEAE